MKAKRTVEQAAYSRRQPAVVRPPVVEADVVAADRELFAERPLLGHLAGLHRPLAQHPRDDLGHAARDPHGLLAGQKPRVGPETADVARLLERSEEHTSALQSL